MSSFLYFHQTLNALPVPDSVTGSVNGNNSIGTAVGNTGRGSVAISINQSPPITLNSPSGRSARAIGRGARSGTGIGLGNRNGNAGGIGNGNGNQNGNGNGIANGNGNGNHNGISRS